MQLVDMILDIWEWDVWYGMTEVVFSELELVELDVEHILEKLKLWG